MVGAGVLLKVKGIIVAVAAILMMSTSALAGDGEAISSEGELYNPPEQLQSRDEKNLVLISEQFVLQTPATEVLLAPLSDAVKKSIVKSTGNTEKVRVAINRDISQLASSSSTAKLLRWSGVPNGGNVAKIILTSPSAAALRAGVTVEKLPGNAELRFYGIGVYADTEISFVAARHVNSTIALNRAAEPYSSEANFYWSPIVEGESMGIELYLPPGENPSDVNIAIPLLSHMALSPFSQHLKLESDFASNACQNDSACYPQWSNMRKATAKMYFQESGGGYICSGTMLNDKNPNNYIPYFLTAAHCIDTQSVASTLYTSWNYESATCNGSARSPAYKRLYNGAKLLWTKGKEHTYTASSMDATFLRLNDGTPAGVYLAGWTTALPTGFKTGIHHPDGDRKKISFGSTASPAIYACKRTTGSSFSCSASAGGSFMKVYWSDGGTEGGSSGSGLYHNNDQVIGALTGGGGGDCAGSRSYYSTFRAAYNRGNLGRWLNTVPLLPVPKAVKTLPSIYQFLFDKKNTKSF